MFGAARLFGAGLLTFLRITPFLLAKDSLLHHVLRLQCPTHQFLRGNLNQLESVHLIVGLLFAGLRFNFLCYLIIQLSTIIHRTLGRLKGDPRRNMIKLHTLLATPIDRRQRFPVPHQATVFLLVSRVVLIL